MGDLISRKALLEALGADVQHLQCWDADLYDLLVAEIEDAPAVEVAPAQIVKAEVNFYDKEETYENCTVQVLTNTVTGEVSVGWWQNDSEPEAL